MTTLWTLQESDPEAARRAFVACGAAFLEFARRMRDTLRPAATGFALVILKRYLPPEVWERHGPALMRHAPHWRQPFDRAHYILSQQRRGRWPTAKSVGDGEDNNESDNEEDG